MLSVLQVSKPPPAFEHGDAVRANQIKAPFYGGLIVGLEDILG
jgi:hypothetical protein